MKAGTEWPCPGGWGSQGWKGRLELWLGPKSGPRQKGLMQGDQPENNCCMWMGGTEDARELGLGVGRRESRGGEMGGDADVCRGPEMAPGSG